MLDFTPLRDKTTTLDAMVADLTVDDLRNLTNEMIDAMLGAIADCTDEDVTFVPHDPNAHDAYATDKSEEGISWTMGHVVVHATASSEEAAAIAAELARGVERDGRSRAETDWKTVTTIAQCRQRLEESRRMRLASLDMWPDEPNLELFQPYGFIEGPVNAKARFVMGLTHDTPHLAQIKDAVAQSKAARSA